MINRLLFLFGLATGYVLGARAGRKRYDGIARTSRTVWSSAPVQRGVRGAQTVLDEQGPVIVERTVETVREVADFVGHAVQGAAVAVGRTAHTVGERIGTTTQDVAGRVGSSTQNIAGRVGQQATEVGHRVAETAEDVRGRVVETAEEARTRVQATAEDLRERGEEAGRRAVFTAAEARDEALASFGDDDDPEVESVEQHAAGAGQKADANKRDDAKPDDAKPSGKKSPAAKHAASGVPTPADIAGSVHREETARPAAASDGQGTTPARTVADADADQK